MTRPTVAVAGVVAFTVVTWLGAGAPWPSHDEAPAARPAVPAHEEPLSDGLRRQAQRLQSYLVSPPPMPAVARNPFEFAGTKTQRSAGAGAPRRAPEHVPSLPPARTPDLRLIGIAEDDAGGAPVRTAMLTSADQLLMVKIGERLLGRYVLASIGTDAVQIKDDETGTTLTLRMK